MRTALQAKGFTLVELLVIIAIVGILASVVLSTITPARHKATDAKAKGELKGLQSAMITYYDSAGIYTDACDEPNMTELLDSATEGSAGPGTPSDGECVDDIDTWAAWVNMLATPTEAFCVDSTGISRIIPAQDSSAVDLLACPN